ncbi:MAG: HIT family protein [Erysipelotrichaceae bacterium]
MCIFCKIINKEVPSEIIYEDDQVIAILDISQATLGHTLVLTKQHYPNFNELPQSLLEHLMVVSQRISKKLINCLEAEGCNILTNINEVAGQSVFHTHIHILPRYKNDDLIIKFTEHQENLAELKSSLV